MTKKLRTLIILLFVAFQFPILQSANAPGTWNGQNTFHIPMAWCAVLGSPASAGQPVPIFPNSPSAVDTDPDSVLWRRQERATNDIWLQQSGISFRSNILEPGPNLHFQIIRDPDTSQGVDGDVLDPDADTNSVTEVERVFNNCLEAWDMQNFQGIGINAVNIDLFFDPSIAEFYTFTVGIGGCARSDVTGACGSPYNGRLMVVDNHYHFPGISNRNFPGTNNHFIFTDPHDHLLGHEAGHALGLRERSFIDTHFLMNPEVQDTNNDNMIDNIDLDSVEVSKARLSALEVTGLEQDPLNKVISGDLVQSDKADEIQEKTSTENIIVPAFLDLASVRTSLDLKENQFSIGQELAGLIQNQSNTLQYWSLLDTDNNNKTGAGEKLLKEIGVPMLMRFSNGTDLVMKADINQINITGAVWHFQDGKLVQLPNDAVVFDLQKMILYPLYSKICDQQNNCRSISSSNINGISTNHIVSITINNEFSQINLDKPFQLQSVTLNKDIAQVEQNTTSDKFESNFTLSQLRFPHCFPQGNATPGRTANIEIQGLTPNSKIHGLLGPAPVFNGFTNSTGGGEIEFPIPLNARTGLNLVTIGVDDSAFTADCVINIVRGGNQTESLRVINPLAFQSSSQEFSLVGGSPADPDSNFIQITAKFSNIVNKQTVIPGQTLKLVTPTNPNAPVNLNWIDDNTLQITSVDKAQVLRGQSTDLRFRLILTGTDTGSGTIKDINGNLLDGDSNGNPGGDYWTVFGRVG